MTSSRQKLKLLYIAEYLKKETDEINGVTVENIIEYLATYDISAVRKSIYDDIAMLMDFGYDITKERVGSQTYYHLVSRDFELPELKLLVDAVQSSKFITTKKSNELISKLEGLVSTYEAKNLHRQVHILNRVKNSNEKIYLNIDSIHEAIQNDHQINFVYTAWDLKKELVPKHDGKIYEVSPWALVWDDENYYLIAYEPEEKKIKHFRVDKMLQLSVSRKQRTGKSLFFDFDIATYSKQNFGMFHGEETYVRLRAKNYLIGVLLDRFGTDIIINPESNGEYFTTNVKVNVSDNFLGWIIGLGPDIKIVSPSTIVNRIKDLLSAQTHLYEE